MHDDELLRRLADAAREEEREESRRLDPRLDELAAGRLPAEDEAALRSELEGSMEGREALAAFTPLGEEFRARVARVARERLDAPAVARARDDAAGAEPTDRRRRRDRARPFAGRRRAWWAAAALAAAALLVVVVLPRAERAPLPGYRFELAGEVRPERAPDDGGFGRSWRTPVRFPPGNRFELVLRPETAVEGRLAVATYRQEGAELVPWPLPVERPHGGTVRIAGTVGREIALPADGAILVVVVGRRGAPPAGSEILAGLGDGDAARGPGWAAWRQTVAPAAGER